MKYAIVKDSAVKNIIEWDGSSEFNVDGELIQADANAKIGGVWDGNVFSFVEPEPEPDTRTYAEKRQAEYPSIDELIVALWEGVVEERMASVTALEGLRQAVKTKYPKIVE
jgi:hypothetical protein